MTPRGEELARRLVGRGEFRWRAGMTGLCDYTDAEWRDDPGNDGPYLVSVTFLSWGHYYSDPVTDTYHWNTCETPNGLYPDLDDPATWGALLAWLWELWPDAILEGSCDGGRFIENGSDQYHGPTPGEAIAAAILAALGDEG